MRKIKFIKRIPFTEYHKQYREANKDIIAEKSKQRILISKKKKRTA